ncbi:putative fanconi anemia group F protein [Dioscorea sansibarensis]
MATGFSPLGISMDELEGLIRGFIDILVLASGYQTSGEVTVWDAENIKRATQWGVFFEDLLERLRESDDHTSSIAELDTALLELSRTSLVPQGIVSISSKTLVKARCLILEHLVQRHELKDEHFLALCKAAMEMDVEKLGIERFKAYIAGLSSGKDGFGEENSGFVIQELLKRQASLACLSSVKNGADTLLKVVARNDSEEMLTSCLVSQEKSEMPMPTEHSLCSQWRSKCLLYLLEDRTMRILSGVNLIFSAPKAQWVQVFERLKASGDDSFLEIMEILLLGFIASRWSFMVKHFMSHSCDALPIPLQYTDIHHLLQESSRSLHPSKESISFQENEILEHLTLLLGTQPHKLLQLPPVIVAMVIPSWSILFRMYLTELEKQLNGTSSIRCCNCAQARKEHRECEVAERIWCLHIFHIRCSRVNVGDSNG